MCAHQSYDLCERHAVLAVQDAQREAERGLEAGDAVGSALKLNLFLMRGVRRVVGGDAVDRAVQQRLDQGEAIGLGTQRWIHLGVGVVVADRPLVEREVVRRGLAGDVQALALRLTNRLESPAR